MQRDETGLKGLDATMCSRLGLVTEIVRQCRSKRAHPAHRTSLHGPQTGQRRSHQTPLEYREASSGDASGKPFMGRCLRSGIVQKARAYVIGRPAGAAPPKPTSPSLNRVQMASSWAVVSIGPPGRGPSEQMTGSAHQVHDGVEFLR